MLNLEFYTQLNCQSSTRQINYFRDTGLGSSQRQSLGELLKDVHGKAPSESKGTHRIQGTVDLILNCHARKCLMV